MSTKFILLVLLAAVGFSASSQAQSPPPADTASIWTIQDENSSISTSQLSDRDYTNGIRLGWTSGEGAVPGFLQGIGQTLWGDGQQRIGFDLSQQIYTPTDNTSGYPPLNDRPFAGVLLGTISLLQDTQTSRSILALGVGVAGPSALGESVQNGFHDLIGQNNVHGWNTQLHDEPLLELTSARIWRLPVATLGGLETDALPSLTAAVGNLRVYAQSGLTMRLGQGLDSDYGVARIQPGLTGTDVFHPTRPLAWYVFAGADAQAVAHDLTIEGNTWQDSRSAKIKPLVGEFQAGLAVLAYGVRLTYTHVVQTQEYKHQKGGLHQFGSLALSVRF